MTAAAPWSVKGIDPRAREVAKDFARRANMTLGEWLNHVILEDETAQGPISAPAEPQPGSPRSAAGEPYRQSGERILAPDHPADEVGKVAMALDRLSARIEASEKRTADMAGRSGSGERELNAVAARFEGAVQELSSEHAKLSERLRRIEAEAVGPRSAAALRSLEGALGKVAERMYEGEGRLDGRFAAIEARLAQTEGGAPAEVLRDLSTSLLALDSRLKGLEDGGAAAMDLRMSRIEERLTKGFEAARVQTVSQVAAIDQRSAKAIERMGAQVAGVTQNLGARLEAVEHRSLQAVERVGSEISRLAGSMEQKLGRADVVQAQALEKLGSEIARITERLAERIATAERRSALAIDDVGEQMARVTDRLTQRHDRASEDIAERIRASEERTARLLEEARERIDSSLHRARGAGAIPAATAGSTIVAPAAPSPAGPAAAPGSTILAPAAPAPGVAPTAPDWALASPFTALDEFDPGSAQGGDAEFSTLAAEPQIQFEGFEEPVYEAGAFPAAAAPSFSPDDFDAADREAHPAATFETLTGDEVAEDLFAPARPRTTREVIEQARASARAAAEAGNGKKGRKGPSLLSAFSKPKEKKSKTSLFGSAGVLAVIAIGAGGLGAASTAIWWLDHQPRAPGLGDPNAGLEVMPMGAPPGARAAIALTPTTQPMTTLAGARSSTTETKATAPVPPAGPAAETLYREGAARIEKKDNSGLASLQKAADMGYAPAQFYLSKLYENGEAGLKKDLVQARAWTQRAANSGDAKAMYNLGLDYYQGAGGEQSYAQAAAWFTKASNAGLTDAQYNLALLYERGVGVSQNMAEAYRWYLTAARLEADPSKKTEDQGAANRIKAQLTADAAGIAERSAGAFQPTVLAAAPASGSSDVATVQRALNRLGYYSGAQDGAPSAALASAITGYQQDQGLTATGRIDPTLVNKLQAFLR